MKNILLVLKEPFLDRIPSLKTLMWYLMEDMGWNITLITSKSEKFPLITFNHINLKLITVKERTGKFELPTTIKLMLKSVNYFLTHKVDHVIGGDLFGNVIASKLVKIKSVPYTYFMLEYPNIASETKFDRLDRKSIESCDNIITHDKWHEDFLRKNFNLINTGIFHLPNASFTPVYKDESDFLQKRLNQYDKKLILHSGGFSPVFRVGQLAQSVSNWPDDCMLVFHTSHSMADNKEYNAIQADKSEKMLFSDKPVSTFDLDKLVASAWIGIALYDESLLAYRATYMGVAAGKIGNYLKCGVPVIATRLPSLQYLEDFNCGILINNESEIAEAIKVISSDRERFSKNAFKCYEELWHPQNYLDIISKQI